MERSKEGIIRLKCKNSKILFQINIGQVHFQVCLFIFNKTRDPPMIRYIRQDTSLNAMHDTEVPYS